MTGGGAGRPGSEPWAGMKTTSHLGGRKAHTARKRRVRYETSTKVSEFRMVVRMMKTVLHARVGSTSIGVTVTMCARRDRRRRRRSSPPPWHRLRKGGV